MDDRDATGGLNPVPVSVIVCAGVVESSVMVIFAVSVPVAVGAKSAWIAQLPPAGTFDPQLFVDAKEDAFVPLRAMLEIERSVPPPLVRVTCCVALVVPTAWLANVRLVAVNVGGAMTPVPDNVIVWGELVASSTIVMAPVNAPSAAGFRVAVIVQLPPMATLCAQVLPNTNEDASVPVTEMPVTARAEVPLLVRVTTWEALAVPNFWLPKVKLVAESVGAATSPLPLSVMVRGEPVASSVILMLAVNAPCAVGAKLASIVQSAPPARVVPQLFEVTNEDAFVPVSAMLEITIGAVLLLVYVTCCEALVVPTAWLAKVRLVGDNAGAAMTPVPVIVTV